MPIKSAVFEIFPWFFFNWVIKYSFSKCSLASFKGEEKDFSNKDWSFSIAKEEPKISSNDSKEKINQIINDVLNPSSKIQDNINILEQSFQSPLKEAREHFEKEYLTNQLKKHHGNISKTADFIGMERSALHRKLKSLGIKGIN